MTSTALAPIVVDAAAHLVNVSGADTDAQLVNVWLSTKASPHTRRAYAADAARFLGFLAGKSVARATVADVQGFADSLEGATSSRARTIGSIKALLSFGLRVGYLRFDVGRAIKAPKAKDGLASRILTEEEALRMIALAPAGRDAVMVRLAYVSGVRVSELVGLVWSDAQPRDDAGTITVLGKGQKTRTILLSAKAWAELVGLRGGAADDAPIFPSRTGRHLDPSAALRAIKRIAVFAGIKRPVSPHWLRHSHASHALDRGAPVHLVQATLGHASLATTSRYTHARPTDSSARYVSA